MDITIVMLDGETHTLRVNPQDTVGSLKMLIQSKLGFPPQKQKLIFVNGQRTPLSDDSKSISYYGLQSGSQVSLLITQPKTFQVFLSNLQGQKSTYDIKPDETVMNFKKRVEHREGVPVNQQRLLFQSKDLQEGKLSDYGVKEHSIINMSGRLRGVVRSAVTSRTAAFEHHLFTAIVSRLSLEVFRSDPKVTSIMDIVIVKLNGETHTLRVNPQDTVGSLKRLIHSSLGDPPEKQKLIFVNGQRTPLNDDSKSISYYGLQSGSQVSLLITQPKTFQVFLSNLQGQKSTYDIKPDETVMNFKRRVEHREGVPVNQQRLLFQSKDLQEGKLSDYGVKELSTINMTGRLRGALGLRPRASRANWDYPPQKQKLIFVNGEKTPLDDDSKSISYYGLQPGSQVSLLITEPPRPATMQVFLRNEKGQISTYDIKPEETVSDFKTKVQHREGVQVSQQRLLHQSREMTTGRLSDYGVREMSTIDLMFRLRGG
ncbi:Polyubiquitin-C [Nibea albiflora]|uniref:Polyubiquitin-C n=1 Tax=Nibea albiflora TaxID=240163 RepID=A0ACB7FD05_NIBAL|nr:Polyubiquitin-C [Nibea albiflora]